jgi:hypothetical protein
VRSVIDIKMTSTRQEICFLAEYAKPNARGKMAVISTLNLKTLEFAFPQYTFSVDESNKVLDWAIGPLMREPLTFYAFILTDRALRMVSLVTGQVRNLQFHAIMNSDFPHSTDRGSARSCNE